MRGYRWLFLAALVTVAVFALEINNESSESTIGTALTTLVAPEVLNESWNYELELNEIEAAAGVIVNHHLLAAQYIAYTLRQIDPAEVKTVLLISPDHFYHSTAWLTTTDRNWLTPDGIMISDSALVKRLGDVGVERNDKPFSEEHGISNIIPFLKRALPTARVVPLIVRPSTPVDLALAEAEMIAPLLNDETLVVGSFDFSHGYTSGMADAHDAIALAAIEKQNFADFSSLDVDSPAGLALMVKLMANRQANFKLLVHGNAAKLLAKPEMDDVTSYIDGLFIKK